MKAHTRSEVLVIRGPGRGRTGTIAGALGRLNPNARKAIVAFATGEMEILPLADLQPAAQMELPLDPAPRQS